MDGPTWSRGLVASMSDPCNVLFEDADLCVIRDKYPKAKTHLLVLAKDPNLVTLKHLKSEHICCNPKAFLGDIGLSVQCQNRRLDYFRPLPNTICVTHLPMLQNVKKLF